MFASIKNNATSKFGIIKLSKKELNRQYSTKFLEPVILDPNITEQYKSLSLLTYACIKQSDCIVSALLKAGADFNLICRNETYS